MKKFFILAFASGILLTSCLKEEGAVATGEQFLATYNYVTHINDDGDPIIKRGGYRYAFDYIDQSVRISAEKINLGANQDSPTFVTKEFKYEITSVPIPTDEGMVFNVYKGSDPFPCKASNGMEVKDLLFEVSQVFYVPPVVTYNKDTNSTLPQPDLSYQAREGAASKIKYRLGENYFVYTFWPDLYYKGKTHTEVLGVPEDSEVQTTTDTENIGYRVKFDIEKKKALVVIYNAKFHPIMPAFECLMLPDLDVQFTNNGYIIEAENVIPLYIGDGRTIMENRNFPFTSFKFVAETNMVEANCEFTVAGRFQGFFTGQYMFRVI